MKKMKTKASHQNKFLKIITIPIRALCKARDFYVKSMTNYADRMNSGHIIGVQGMSQVSGLPKSFSVNSARSFDNEDFRELVRASSTGSKADVDSYIRQQKTGSGPPRSSSVAMGRIDEERPCCYFGDIDNIIFSANSIISVKNEVINEYPRSKSHSVIRKTVF